MTAFGGVETGGTKWECAIGRGPGDLLATEMIPTTTPVETIGRAVAFFRVGGAGRRSGVLGAIAFAEAL